MGFLELLKKVLKKLKMMNFFGYKTFLVVNFFYNCALFLIIVIFFFSAVIAWSY